MVILGQDPYANEGQAIGRAFAVSESTEMPPSLKYIFKEVRRDYPPGLDAGTDPGVVGQAGSVLAEHHSDGGAWSLQQPRQHWVENAVTIPTLKKLSAEREHLVFMLWGVPAKSFEQILDQRRHLVLKAGHPSRPWLTGFRGCGHFRKANSYLSKHGIEPIIWTLVKADS